MSGNPHWPGPETAVDCFAGDVAMTLVSPSPGLKFQYGQSEIKYLKRRDPALGQAINKIGIIERPVIPDLFKALVKSVVGQQISKKAAATVWNRFCVKYPIITPRGIAHADVADIQKCGLSMRKAGYIAGIGEAVVSGDLGIKALSEMPDDAVIKKLSSIPGVGVWTAEMLLIFSLCRPDVVSWGDLAIRRGMMVLYGLSRLTKEQFDHYRGRYAPHGSVASLYLWELSAK